ncbi:multidrug resistance-associated ABC transporter [Mucidula mucida]|nr:multidrug resistance-associated ABC transporter [Mucidula mucida]
MIPIEAQGLPLISPVSHRSRWLPQVSATFSATTSMKLSNPFAPKPAPPGFGEGTILPEEDASLLSRLLFNWLGSFLNVGFTRPLDKDDLWELPNSFLTSSLADEIEVNFYSRCPPDERPVSLRHKIPDSLHEKRDDEKRKDAFLRPLKYDKSLPKALHQTFFFRFWASGILKLFGDTLKTTTPLVTKVLLTWLTDSYIWWRLSDEQRASGVIPQPQGIGYGIGVGVGLFLMQETASLFTNHSSYYGMTLGLAVRTSVIGAIFRKSLRLSGRARLDHSVGKITTMISTDATRLDRFSNAIHVLWVSPIQIIIGIALLINNLGYSALVGVGVLVFSFPVQILMAKMMFMLRKKTVKVTDSRVRLTTEVLQGVRLIKLYAWEAFYSHQVGFFRAREVSILKRAATVRSALISLVTFVPILAAVLSFITYALTNHDLNVAIIFSSLQFLNIIRAPLIYFPFVLAFMSDAMVALGRISTFLTAEELANAYSIEEESKHAVRVDGNFTWESARPSQGPKFEGLMTKKQKALKAKKDEVLPTTIDTLTDSEGKLKGDETPVEEKPFELRDLHLAVPKGSFVAIVGRVGSGKSSILQALIGEMRRLDGQVVFGGSVSYVPQAPWIRNTTLRENVMFGQPLDVDKLDEVIQACCLEHDIEMLPHGDMTEIGEKGINLSGGQKARVSLARAAYSPSEIVLLDDPLSAVDAYVGKSILENCLLNGPLASRTRILVTHALHVLDKADYIYVVDDGQIKEQGTYADLMGNSVIFSRIMEEHGSLEHEEKAETDESTKEVSADVKVESLEKKGTLMQEEERVTGSVAWATYRDYMRFAGGLVWFPIFVTLLTLNQVAAVGNNLMLGFWTADSINGFTQGQYMGVYAGLGAAQAVFAFLLSFCFALSALIASLRMFKASLSHVLRSPVSFFDTTPVGRILSRLSKDQDTLDGELAMTLTQFLNTFTSVLGTIGLVFYTFPYLGIIFAPMSILYYIVQLYYRRTSVETKRLDSLMRSSLYSSYSETLTGLATIRAYREQGRCVRDAEHGLDMENRAYFMTIAIQRWLSVRLDMFGNVLVLGIVLFAAGFRHTVEPSKIGVVLTYTLSITQVFSEMVNQFAQNEQNMNAVERVLVYTRLPAEGRPELETEKPPSTWPAQGEVAFNNVDLSYRPNLPLVLKDVSFNIKAGEKVGIIGRTGAGKSSLLQALFRIVELQNGRIEIDGIDISKVSLETLRSRLALVPQDTTMFLGTLRENLDPQHTRTDAELISVLQRAWLLPSGGVSDPAADAKFRLDATVGDEGANFSAGEKQLLALARALVKNSRIIILDEATSSVDVETDAKLQRTIQTEFATSTLLCIAHRLNTVAYYDRILVMDSGRVAEFDTVLNLFDKEDSIFRSLCNEAKLTKADILRIRAENLNAKHDT